MYDVSVKVGDIVDLLDDSDPGWYLVRKSDGFEGYVPSNYITQLHVPSARDLDRSNNDLMGSTRVNGHIENVTPNNSSVNKSKTDKNEIPISWKVTNDLKGKSPITTAHDTEETSKQKKQRPKKPPRKKKANLDGLSPRLNESTDSIDTFITECSSTDYVENSIKSPLDGLSPRSDDLSDSSVFESSFNGVYGYRQCASALSDAELSPRSLNVQSYDDSASEDMSRSGGPIEQMSVNERDDNKTVITNRQQKQESNQYGRNISCGTSDSFESRSSYGQRQKRPVSLPAFRSYQEYKKDYFDEYFYDDADTKFANKAKHNVVNVAEILKLRNESKLHAYLKQKHNAHNSKNSEKYHQIRKSSSTAESKSHGQCMRPKDANNQPKLKQFLLELPSTKIEKQKANTNRLSSTDIDDVGKENIKRKTQENKTSTEGLHKNSKPRDVNEFNGKDTKCKSPERYGYLQEYDARKQRDNKTRQYNSSSDLRQIEGKHSSMNADYDHPNHLGNVSNKKNENKQKKAHLRPYNSSTDLRDIGGKPDWSFGYPRRTRQSIGRQEDRNTSNEVTNDNRRDTKSNSKRGKNNHGIQDRMRKGESIQKGHKDLNRVKQTPDVSNADKSRKAQIEDCNKVLDNEADNECFDDEAMMALLDQTDTLLNKTEVLLHHNKKGRINKQEANNLLNPNDHLLNKYLAQKLKGDNDKHTSSPLHHSKDETGAVDKCHLFLNSSTIGIHGMTYFVTSDNETIGEKITIDTLDGNLDSEIACSSLGSCQSVNSDSRKEKSSVMKDNSSKEVSEEIKSMDLQDIRGITEFVCQCDNDNDTDDMLPIKYGEIVHIGLDGQDGGNRYWAFSPRLKKYGFVFKQNVKIPMVTII